MRSDMGLKDGVELKLVKQDLEPRPRFIQVRVLSRSKQPLSMGPVDLVIPLTNSSYTILCLLIKLTPSHSNWFMLACRLRALWTWGANDPTLPNITSRNTLLPRQSIYNWIRVLIYPPPKKRASCYGYLPAAITQVNHDSLLTNIPDYLLPLES